MILLEGPEFINADPKVVAQYLSTTSREIISVNPSNLKVNNNGKFLILQILNGKIKEYPIRKSFLYKLLKWYSFPISQLYRMSIDTVASLCNDYLLNIKSDNVRVKIENNEALTIIGPKYNELTDLEVIDKCMGLGIKEISRNDFFIRIYTREKFKTEPIPDDPCGFGLNIFNSETGFRALSVAHYIIRYVCSNGAVVQVDSNNESRIHFGQKEGELKEFLDTQILRAYESRVKLIKLMQKSSKEKADSYINQISLKIDRLLGRNSSQLFMEDLKENSTKYDLFNIITARAKEYDISKRLYLERIAGDLLTN